ncbi:receptor-type tyrosine-protein phosphatase alpha-like [Ammospiza maritima maritima]
MGAACLRRQRSSVCQPSLLRAEPGCDELRGQRGANMSYSEQGWAGLGLLHLRWAVGSHPAAGRALGHCGTLLTHTSSCLSQTYTEEERIIITQLPFPTTLVDFWALVWDYTCTSVVVLNELQELDKTYVQFWPSQGEDDYGRFHVQLISEEPGAGFTTWTLVLSNRQQPKKSAVEIQLHQLTDWPMQKHLPPNPDTIISLLGKVETHHRQSQDGHILVTCWDGASRSGIFCAAGFLCEQIQSEGMVDVSQAVRMLKRRRRQFIKNVEQYGLCYELALSYLNSFETYGNFK